MQPNVQSSFQKWNVDNSCQKTRRNRYYILEALPNCIVSLYFVPNILSRIVFIFNLWIVGKNFSKSQSCDYGHRFIEQLDSQQSIPDPKRGNVTSTPQPFTFGVKTQIFSFVYNTVSCSTNTNFHWPKVLLLRASTPIQVLNFWGFFVWQDSMNVLTTI